MAKNSGFTLLELMVVLLILAILAAFAMPLNLPITTRRQLDHALKLPRHYQASIGAFYEANGRFPSDNTEAGMPEPEQLINNMVTSMTLEDGAFHVVLGNRAIPLLKGKVLTMQPLVVTGSPTSPIDWTCGLAPTPSGMERAGENKTNIEIAYLPADCK